MEECPPEKTSLDVSAHDFDVAISKVERLVRWVTPGMQFIPSYDTIGFNLSGDR